MAFVKLGEICIVLKFTFILLCFCPPFNIQPHSCRNGASLIIEQFFPSLLTQGLFPPAHSNPNSGVELMKFSAS